MKRGIVISTMFFVVFCLVTTIFGDEGQNCEKSIGSNFACKDANFNQSLNCASLENFSQKIIRKAYRKIENANIDELVDLMADDVVWTIEGVQSVVPFAKNYIGKEGVRQYFQDFNNAVGLHNVDIEEYLAQGLKVDVHLLESGVVNSTNTPYQSETVHKWELNRQGKIIRFHSINDTYAIAFANMETSKNIATVRLYYQKMLTGDVAGIIDLTTEDFTAVLFYPASTPYAGVHYGQQGLLQLLASLHANISSVRFDIKNILTGPGQVIVKIVETATVISTGKSAAVDHIHVFTISNGKVSKFEGFIDGDKYADLWVND